MAQVRQSPTPIIVNLITPTPVSLQQSVATVTPTFTPTAKGPVLLEAKESAGNVNVRAEPDPNGQRLGGISFGTQYPVLRQYFSWYELQYDTSPNGRAWVYGELVDIVGDVAEITVIEVLDAQATEISDEVQATETWEAITLEPGGVQTATANARVLAVPTVIQAEEIVESVLEATPMPTFTYPPDVVAVAPTTSINDAPLSPQNSGQPDRLPPLFPILLLGGSGIIGLLLNSLRR